MKAMLKVNFSLPFKIVMMANFLERNQTNRLIGTEPTIKKDHAKYLNHWVEILKDDEKAILKAASLAGKAFDFLLNLQEQKNKNMAA
jgi:antirestriction protein ArdC